MIAHPNNPLYMITAGRRTHRRLFTLPVLAGLALGASALWHGASRAASMPGPVPIAMVSGSVIVAGLMFAIIAAGLLLYRGLREFVLSPVAWSLAAVLGVGVFGLQYKGLIALPAPGTVVAGSLEAGRWWLILLNGLDAQIITIAAFFATLLQACLAIRWAVQLEPGQWKRPSMLSPHEATTREVSTPDSVRWPHPQVEPAYSGASTLPSEQGTTSQFRPGPPAPRALSIVTGPDAAASYASHEEDPPTLPTIERAVNAKN